MFFDLCLDVAADTSEETMQQMATTAMSLGYGCIAWNTTVNGGKLSAEHECAITLPEVSSATRAAPSAISFHSCKTLRQLTRLTFCAEAQAQVYTLNANNPVLKTYDLIAVRPLSEAMFVQACNTLEVDIISLDLSSRLPFRMRFPTVNSAISRGVHFEITYSAMIRDRKERAMVISNALALHRVTKGRNVILSSSARTAMELRGPYDLANLCHLFGMNETMGKATISSKCRDLLLHADARCAYRGVMSVRKMDDTEASEQWKIGGASDPNGDVEDDAAPMEGT